MKNPDKPPTVKDVAHLAGVSYSTAAAALRGAPHVRDSTRDRIFDAAKALNYRPNRSASNLVGSRFRRRAETGTPLAYLVWTLPEQDVRGHLSVHAGAEARARELGYDLHAYNLAEVEDHSRLWDVLFARGFEGLLIARTYPHRVEDLHLPWEKFCAVAVGHYHRLWPLHCVRDDAIQNLRTAYEELYQRGCRRIAASIHRHEPELLDDQDRHACVLEMEERLDLEISIPPWRNKLKGFEEDFVQWFRRYKPDGLIALTSVDAFVLKDAGHEFKRDYLFASLREPDKVSRPWPISGMAIMDPLLGETGIDMLDMEIRHQRRGKPANPRDVLIRSHWITREST